VNTRLKKIAAVAAKSKQYSPFQLSIHATNSHKEI